MMEENDLLVPCSDDGGMQDLADATCKQPNTDSTPFETSPLMKKLQKQKITFLKHFHQQRFQCITFISS